MDLQTDAVAVLAKPEFQELIDKKAKWQVDQFLFGRENGERPTLQIKRFIEGIISADYHGRTLIELIQNAHDAHDKDAVDGQIRVVLDETEGPFGTLYVANGGRPLTDRNFAAMVDVAVSDKPPSEGIGNKGVGFKSVLQFSECPEVYSRSSADTLQFDGFTFRFGTEDDFVNLAARWAPRMEGLSAELAENVSTLTLTFPLVSAPQRVTELGDAGFCTVIRLPLKSERALDDARGELEAVAGSDVPMHLFLDRIETIDLVTIGLDGETSLSLTRLVEDIDRARCPTRSLLQDDSEFIVARRTVPESTVWKAIEATRDAGAHLPGWDKWEGDAEVVLALSAGGPLDSPRLYNFLPMGDRVECPLPAYLQAPFFSSLDRRSLDETYPINELFLDEAAALAADLLTAATEGHVEFPPGTLVDLGCWSKGHLPRLVAVLENRSCPLAGLAFLPSREAATPSRVSVADGSLWDVYGEHFTPARLEPEQLRGLIDPGLGSTRIARLADLYRELGHAANWRTGSETLVAFAETCAAHLQSTGASPEEWVEFYDELAASLPRSAPLAGAKIVAGVGRLLQANGAPGSPTVFFPPQRGVTESRMQPPEAVAHQLAYVRDDIPWRLDDKSYRAGRQWLSECVADFGSEDILRVVAEVMGQQDLDPADLNDSLRYALDVWRNARSPLGEEYFPATPFRVPTFSGWVAADEAYFGKGWAGDDAWVDEALVRLVVALGDEINLDGIADSILQTPSDWVAEEDIDAMREFLERAGVRHGLWPIEVESARWNVYGSTLNSPTSLSRHNLPGWVPTDLREMWLDVACQWPGRSAAYTTVEYRLVHIARLPGQSEWSDFSTRAQEIFGELVLAGLDRWEDLDLHARFERPQSGDVATWPSFVTTFLLTSPWFPQREPGDRTKVTLAPIADAWWVEGDAPPYLPAPSPHLRRSVGSRAIERLRALGARHWDAEDSAVARIEYLAQLISQDGAWVRGTRAEYERSWVDFLADPASDPPHGVLVERLGAVELAEIADDGETIYYAVPDVPQAALLAQLPLARLGFTDRSLSRRVGRYVSAAAPNRFKSVADAEIKAFWTEPTSQGPLLDLLGDWFETLVLLVLSHQQGVLSRSSRQLGQAVHRLRTTNLIVVDQFSTSVDGYQVQDPQGQSSCWVEGDDGRGVVLVRHAPGLTRIELAERAAEGIAQAVGVPAVFKDLRLALVDLRTAVRGGTPSNADLATALRLPEGEVELARAERGAVRPDTSTLVTLLATLAPDVAEELRDTPDIPTDRSEMQAWLGLRLSGTDVDAAVVLSYEERGWATGPIEEGLVSLKEANDGLRTLGLEPVANTEVQVREFTAFIAARKSVLADALRDRFSSKVAEDPNMLASYAALLELPNLRHDPVWPDLFWRVPVGEMAKRVEQWLVGVAGPPVARTLPSVDDLRGRQRQSMTSSLTTARDSVLTWCELNEVPAPPLIDVASVSAQIRSSGYLDFGERTSDEFVAWLAAHGYWPSAMPHTLNQRELGITQEDLRKARDRKRREADEAKRREATIAFEGKEYTGDPDDLLKLDEAIADALAEVDLGETPSLEELNELPPTRLGGGGGSRNPPLSKPARVVTLPPGKLANIGLAGEIFAGHWIASNFGLPREQTWRSGARNDIIGDGLGDDSLGYDFEVLAGDLTYLIEVKATTGSDTSFQLPESEIRRALSLAPHERYTILFVGNVLDSQLRRFHWLPNPLGPAARLFRVDGREMKFRFEVATEVES
ncbi:sacsin N-terminal ATP-binding-like domain-containing protein [Janibacter melonis]|uniref:sacsin N-terminal ATP-binding-like domain-containing protein n=1 Tax=Janibacter melonis TaxID=262209 RepID=UPI002094B2AE|nr:DUF3883 domain-containing protein [Janibacter melonis]